MDFVNAKFTDEACHQLIVGLQQVFNLSSDFTEKATKAFPNIDELISSLTKQERTLLSYFCKEKNLIAFVAEELKLFNYEYEDHDYQKQTLTFWEISWTDDALEDDSDDGPTYTGPITKRIDELKEPNGESMSPEIFKKIRTLMEMGIKIQKLKDRILEKRYCEIKKLSEFYLKWHPCYEIISVRRGQLKKIVNDIVNGKALSKIKSLDEFLIDYNPFCELNLQIKSDGTFVYKPHPFDETSFITCQ